MPNPKSRNSERLQFRVATARTVRIPVADAPPLLPWPLAAVGGGVLAGLAGLLLVVGVVMVAWFSAITIPLPTVLGFAAQVWLLAHGGELMIAGSPVTLVPLGLTGMFAVLCAWTGGFAYRQGRQARTGEPDARRRRVLLFGSAGQVAAGYTGFAILLAWTVLGPSGILRPALGALAVSLVGAGFGALLASGRQLENLSPRWFRAALRGTMAGGLGLVIAGAVVLGTALILGENRIAALEDGIGFDSAGAFVWSMVALAYLPNLLVWALAWVLGAGLTVGAGSLVTLWTTQLGILPAIPVLGALPPAGVASGWLLSWLVLGVAIGALAGVTAAATGRPGLLGALTAAALAGLATGLLYLGWAAAGRGGLGSLRLLGLGPRLVESLLIGVPLLLLSAALAGVVAWVVRRSRPEA